MWVGAVGAGILSLSHLCALSSMQCRETGIGTSMLLDGLVVPHPFSVIAFRICDHQGTFESPLSSLLQPKGRRVLQRIDIGLILDDLREQVFALVLPVKEGFAGVWRFRSILGT